MDAGHGAARTHALSLLVIGDYTGRLAVFFL